MDRTRVFLILAGGRGRRFGGVNKALLKIGGERLIDRVLAAIEPQSDCVYLSANAPIDTDLMTIPDREDGPLGPAAGLWAFAHFLGQHHPSVDGFFTAPIDAPSPPADLVARLSVDDASAIAGDQARVHPTFAFWRCADVLSALQEDSGRGVALLALAERCGAKRVCFSDATGFTNINTPDELDRAHSRD